MTDIKPETGSATEAETAWVDGLDLAAEFKQIRQVAAASRAHRDKANEDDAEWMPRVYRTVKAAENDEARLVRVAEAAGVKLNRRNRNNLFYQFVVSMCPNEKHKKTYSDYGVALKQASDWHFDHDDLRTYLLAYGVYALKRGEHRPDGVPVVVKPTCRKAKMDGDGPRHGPSPSPSDSSARPPHTEVQVDAENQNPASTGTAPEDASAPPKAGRAVPLGIPRTERIVGPAVSLPPPQGCDDSKRRLGYGRVLVPEYQNVRGKLRVEIELHGRGSFNITEIFNGSLVTIGDDDGTYTSEYCVISSGLRDTAFARTFIHWHPFIGCSPASEGCVNCDSIGEASRWLRPRRYKNNYIVSATLSNPSAVWTGNICNTGYNELCKPLNYNEPSLFLCANLSDFFHENVPDEYRDQAFSIMDKSPHHRFVIMTKRSKLIAATLDRMGRSLPTNVWLGVSVENSDELHRIDDLRNVSASLRLVWFEPLIGPVGKINLEGIHSVVVGPERFVGARPCNVEWVRDIRDQCCAANIPFAFNGWISNESNPLSADYKSYCKADESLANFLRRVGGDDFNMMLDGAVYEQFPTDPTWHADIPGGTEYDLNETEEEGIAKLLCPVEDMDMVSASADEREEDSDPDFGQGTASAFSEQSSIKTSKNEVAQVDKEQPENPQSSPGAESAAVVPVGDGEPPETPMAVDSAQATGGVKPSADKANADSHTQDVAGSSGHSSIPPVANSVADHKGNPAAPLCIEFDWPGVDQIALRIAVDDQGMRGDVRQHVTFRLEDISPDKESGTIRMKLLDGTGNQVWTSAPLTASIPPGLHHPDQITYAVFSAKAIIDTAARLLVKPEHDRLTKISGRGVPEKLAGDLHQGTLRLTNVDGRSTEVRCIEPVSAVEGVPEVVGCDKPGDRPDHTDNASPIVEPALADQPPEPLAPVLAVAVENTDAGITNAEAAAGQVDKTTPPEYEPDPDPPPAASSPLPPIPSDSPGPDDNPVIPVTGNMEPVASPMLLFEGRAKKDQLRQLHDRLNTGMPKVPTLARFHRESGQVMVSWIDDTGGQVKFTVCPTIGADYPSPQVVVETSNLIEALADIVKNKPPPYTFRVTTVSFRVSAKNYEGISLPAAVAFDEPDNTAMPPFVSGDLVYPAPLMGTDKEGNDEVRRVTQRLNNTAKGHGACVAEHKYDIEVPLSTAKVKEIVAAYTALKPQARQDEADGNNPASGKNWPIIAQWLASEGNLALRLKVIGRTDKPVDIHIAGDINNEIVFAQGKTAVRGSAEYLVDVLKRLYGDNKAPIGLPSKVTYDDSGCVMHVGLKGVEISRYRKTDECENVSPPDIYWLRNQRHLIHYGRTVSPSPPVRHI